MTPQTSSELGVLLRRHRLAAGLTQDGLAEAAGVSARSIGDLERGLPRTPYPSTIRRLAIALDLNAEERTTFLDAASQAAARATDTTPAHETRSSRPWPRFSIPRLRVAAVIAAGLALAVIALVLVRATSANQGPRLGAFVRSLAVSRTVGLGRPTAIAVARDGTKYVLDQSTATIRVFGSGGSLRATWGSMGSRPGQMHTPGGLALDSRNDVYVADTGNDRIEKFDRRGRLLSVWGRQTAGLASMRSPVDIAVNSAGVVYVADARNLHVLRLDSSGHRHDDLAPPGVPFYGAPKLAGVAVGPSGNIYVADVRNDLVLVYGPGGAPTSNQLQLGAPPSAIAANSSGDIYVAYRSLAEIQEYSSQGVQLRTWRGNGLELPTGIALDTTGHPLVADPGSHAVLRSVGRRWIPSIRYRLHSGAVSVAGRIAVGAHGLIALADVRTGRVSWLSHGSRASSDVALTSSRPARFVGPIGGLAVAPNGSLYVSDYGAGHVLNVGADGHVGGIWGQRPSDPGMSHPQGLATDGAGNVYVVDEDGGRVEEFTSQGRSLAVFPIPQPAPGSLVGPSPYGVAVDSARDLYITDEIGDHVVKLDATGRVVFVWGNRGLGRTGLRVPQGIAVDERRRRIYVADDGNNRIQILSTTGKWKGSIPANHPEDVAVDPASGLVYILDAAGTRVQVFRP